MSDILDNKWIRGLFAAVGFGIFALGVTLLVTVVLLGTGGGEAGLAGTAGAAVCMAFTSLFGALLCGYGVYGLFSEDGIERDVENRMLRVARAHGGTVTVAQVAQDSDLTMRESQALLEELAREGLVRLEIDDQGVEQYVFSGLQGEGADVDDQAYERTLREARRRVGQIDEETDRREQREVASEPPHKDS